MRTLPIGIALFALLIAPALPAGPSAQASNLTWPGPGHGLHWSDRHDPAAARLAITTEDGDVTLLLTERDVVFQLSQSTMRKVHRELRDAEDEQEHWLASTIVTAVTGVVREVLDHSFVSHVRDLRDVSYEHGRLVFTGRNGQELFGDEDDCDSDFSGTFSQRDGERFVREFRRLKAGK
jgi:hypothetical protein